MYFLRSVLKNKLLPGKKTRYGIIKTCGDTTGSHACNFRNGLKENKVHIKKQPTKTDETHD